MIFNNEKRHNIKENFLKQIERLERLHKRWDLTKTGQRKMQITKLPKIEWKTILLGVKPNESFSHPKLHTSDLIRKVFPYKKN